MLSIGKQCIIINIKAITIRVCFGLKKRNKIDRNKKIIWKRKNKIEIKWYVILFVLREICEIEYK